VRHTVLRGTLQASLAAGHERQRGYRDLWLRSSKHVRGRFGRPREFAYRSYVGGPSAAHPEPLALWRRRVGLTGKRGAAECRRLNVTRFGGDSGTLIRCAADTRKAPKNKDSEEVRPNFVTTAVYHSASRFGRQSRTISRPIRTVRFHQGSRAEWRRTPKRAHEQGLKARGSGTPVSRLTRYEPFPGEWWKALDRRKAAPSSAAFCCRALSPAVMVPTVPHDRI
jgi:hypothetical protein